MYSKTTHVTGDIFTAVRANNLESQYEEATDETHAAPTISSGTLVLNLASARVFKVALNANVTTLTLQNVPANTRRVIIELKLTADGSARTFAWLTSTVKWAASVAPTLTTTSTRKDWFVLWTDDGGTTWFGAIVGQNYN